MNTETRLKNDIAVLSRVDAHLPDQVGLEEADGLGGPATLCQAAARFQSDTAMLRLVRVRARWELVEAGGTRLLPMVGWH